MSGTPPALPPADELTAGLPFPASALEPRGDGGSGPRPGRRRRGRRDVVGAARRGGAGALVDPGPGLARDPAGPSAAVQRALCGGRLDNRAWLRVAVGTTAFALVLAPTGMGFLSPSALSS